jgi:catechol 2,3-dioxygenase-like lactoylglutathione lyase family enzyme
MPAMPKPVRLDGVAIGSRDPERSSRFYLEVLNADVTTHGHRSVYRFGEQQLDVLTAEVREHAGDSVLPGPPFLRFAWPGSVEDAVAHLARQGVEIESGPSDGSGARGDAPCVRFRDPDGLLIELIAYGG